MNEKGTRLIMEAFDGNEIELYHRKVDSSTITIVIPSGRGITVGEHTKYRNLVYSRLLAGYQPHNID